MEAVGLLSKILPTSTLWATFQTPCTSLSHFETFEAGILAPILNSLSEGFTLTDASGSLKVFNKSAMKYLGRDLSSVPRPEWFENCGFYNPQTDEKIPCAELPGRRALSGEEVEGLELILKSPAYPNGILLEVSAHPIRDEHGKIHGAISVMKDISQRRVAEMKLAQFASIVSSTDDSVMSVDLGGTILSWNHGAEKLWGYSASEMIGQNSEKLIPGDFEKVHLPAMEKIKKGESIQKHEVWSVRKCGDRILVSSTVSPFRNGRGDIIGSCIISRDITEVKRAEEQIRRLADNLKRSNDELKQFAYIASHDLREPLRTVSSFAKLMDRDYNGLVDSRGREFLKLMVEGVDRMKLLIDSLLEYSRVEQFPLRRETVDCGRMVEGIRANLRLALQESGARLEVEDLPTIFADEVQMGQLMQNLILNAIKFRNGKSPWIKVFAGETDSAWQFSVEDNGIGVDPRFQDRIFQIFQRLHAANEYPGTGLGLAICKKIAERHGGRIWCESNAGREGTTFHFSIPREY